VAQAVADGAEPFQREIRGQHDVEPLLDLSERRVRQTHCNSSDRACDGKGIYRRTWKLTRYLYRHITGPHT
jgi:hypothetical protein